MTPSRPATGVWHPMDPAAARRVLCAVDATWWIAGGWALDLFVGTQTRAHKDLDVGVRRRDAAHILAALPGWEFFEAHEGSLERLLLGVGPRAKVNSLWGRLAGEPYWMLELMLDDSDDEHWIFRRDPSIRRPLAAALRGTAEGTRYLAPEIQLLYKARDLRPEDQADFERIAPRLDAAAVDWLREAVSRLYPQHRWLTPLARTAAARNGASGQVHDAFDDPPAGRCDHTERLNQAASRDAPVRSNDPE
jgi:hypothetical protein